VLAEQEALYSLNVTTFIWRCVFCFSQMSKIINSKLLQKPGNALAHVSRVFFSKIAPREILCPIHQKINLK
jgi:hypothetical protein